MTPWGTVNLLSLVMGKSPRKLLSLAVGLRQQFTRASSHSSGNRLTVPLEVMKYV